MGKSTTKKFKKLLSLILFVIVLETPNSGAQECEFSESKFICRNVVSQFPKENYYRSNLKCVDCEIRKFDNHTFPYENNLQLFDISHSGLQQIGSFSFFNLQRLNYLYLQNNDIVHISVDAFNGLVLSELHLQNNTLKALNPGFLNGLLSECVNISDNVLESVPEKVFEGSVGLNKLYLSHNSINMINKDAFMGLTKLEELDLSFNLLCHIPYGTFRMLNTLRRLYLASNKFTTLKTASFSGLKNLLFLDLARNSLTTFDSTWLFAMKYLTHLNISGNDIKNGFQSILSTVPTLKVITFEDNIFSCLQLIEVLRFFRSKQVYVFNNIFRYEYNNVDGIACTDNFTYDIFSGTSLLESLREEADSLNTSC